MRTFQGKKTATNRRRPILIFVAIGLALLTAFAFVRTNPLPRSSQEENTANPVESPVAPVLGSVAPDFTLINTNGEERRLSTFRGQPVLINFWATWCGPCRIEMPAIQSRFEQYGPDQGLVVLAVDFDEPKADVVAFGRELGLTFDLLLDPGASVQELYRMRGYPTSFFVDAQGIIQVHHIGLMTETQLDGYLSQIGVEL